MSILYNLFGKALYYIYCFVGNYGLAIVVFSILAKLIQMPVTIKQIKMQEANKVIMPKIEEIKVKYKNNQQKQSEEMMKVYQEAGVSPAGGCLPLILQFVLIIVFFRIVRMPETYVFPGTEAASVAISQGFLWVKNMMLSPNEIFAQSGVSVDLLLSLILPIITVVTTVIMQKQSNVSTPDAGGTGGMTMKMMNLMLPVMIAVFSLSYTPALCLYWSMNTLLQIIQYSVMKKKSAEAAHDDLLR